MWGGFNPPSIHGLSVKGTKDKVKRPKVEVGAWQAHLRPSLSLFVVDIDLRVIGLLKPRGRDIFKSRS